MLQKLIFNRYFVRIQLFRVMGLQEREQCLPKVLITLISQRQESHYPQPQQPSLAQVYLLVFLRHNLNENIMEEIIADQNPPRKENADVRLHLLEARAGVGVPSFPTFFLLHISAERRRGVYNTFGPLSSAYPLLW